jgi:Spy/CpxP family protein refolding chaperone
MASQMGWVLAGLLALGTVPGAEGAGCEQGSPKQGQQAQQKDPSRDDRRDYREPFENHPRYPWWKDDKAMAAAGFSADQGAQIDRIFRETYEKTRPLREEVMQLQKALNQTIEANVAEVGVFAKQVDKIEMKRAELNKLRLVMLYGMHRVLTPEQNAKLLTYFEKREAERRKQDGDRRR